MSLKTNMLFYFIILMLIPLSSCEQFYQIEDIPIEHFEQTDFEEDAMDFELMPRSDRSFFNLGPSKIDVDESADKFHRGTRSKRETRTNKNLEKKATTETIVIGLGKPLEVAVIGPQNLTLKNDAVSTTINAIATNENNDIDVNDFIRFRRSSEVEQMGELEDKMKDGLENREQAKLQSETKKSPKQSVEAISHSQKLVVTRGDPDKESTREARGATNEQWVKQPYIVRRNDDYDDSYPASSDTVRAPRVHFVTQNRDNRYDREARARSLNTELDRKLGKDMSAEMDAYHPRYSRPWRYDDREDPYYNDPDPRDTRIPYRHDRMNEYYPERPRAMYDDIRRPAKKPRRIIYYATLPDISRTPPNGDYRDRGRYDDRDRYDDRYASPDPYRNRYRGYAKPRYEENSVRGDKPSYPVKVTTDLSVREVKKNPERRIYSDVDRSRYAQDAPHQLDRM